MPQVRLGRKVILENWNGGILECCIRQKEQNPSKRIISGLYYLTIPDAKLSGARL